MSKAQFPSVCTVLVKVHYLVKLYLLSFMKDYLTGKSSLNGCLTFEVPLKILFLRIILATFRGKGKP